MRHHNSRIRLLGAVVAISALLSGCGEEAPPSAYTIGEDTLPSLNDLVTLGEDVQFTSQQTEEDGPVTYTYAGLASGSQTAETYAKDLEDAYSCSLLDPEGDRLAEEDVFSADSGEVLVAVEGVNEDGLFQLDLSWDETSCTVTPSFAQGAELPEDNPTMTLEEAAAYLQSFPPADLGLEGEDMSAYNILPEEGVVLLDDEPCICLNVYLESTHQYCATYLIAGQSDQLYRLDRSTGEASALSP